MLCCLHFEIVFCRQCNTFAAASGKSAVLSAENGMHVQTVQHFCYPKMQKCCTVCTKAPKSHHSIRDFMGVNSPILRPILEGPPAHNPYCWRTDLGDTGIQASGRRRSLPIRPYLHARITRITSVEQLPQNIFNTIPSQFHHYSIIIPS